MATHKFRVGEKVQFLGGQGVRFATAEIFEIVRQLPESDGECQYWSFWHRPCLWPSAVPALSLRKIRNVMPLWVTASPRQMKRRKNNNSYLTRTRS